MASEIAHFEAEAEATRERIAATVGELQYRLSPRTLVNNAIDGLGTQGNEVIASVQKVARGNPVSIAAAGLAVGLLVLGRSHLKNVKIADVGQFAAYPDYDDGYGANSVDDRWADDHPVALVPVHSRIERQAVASPLAALVVAMTVGAIVGALLPTTRFETEMLADSERRIAARRLTAAV